MINPVCWLRFQRTRRAVADYPLYDPPNKAAEGTLPIKEIEDNFAYFINVRLQRLAFFRLWLSNHFGVEASLNGAGVLAIEKWADQFSGGLVMDSAESSEIFRTYRPDWEGKRRGYNVLVDVAIFLGEFLISKRSHLYWTLLKDEKGSCVDGREGPIGFTFGRPDLAGFVVEPFMPDLFRTVYRKAVGSNDCLEIGGNRLRRIHVSFAWTCRESLAVADHRDPSTPFIYGDYSYGPL